MSKLRPLVHPVKDEKARKAWEKAFSFCWVCGRRFGLNTHHIAFGQAGRSDEPCNFFRACIIHHACIHGQTIVYRGRRHLPIGYQTVYKLKQKYDPENWNPERLCELFGRECLPDMEPLEG